MLITDPSWSLGTTAAAHLLYWAVQAFVTVAEWRVTRWLLRDDRSRLYRA